MKQEDAPRSHPPSHGREYGRAGSSGDNAAMAPFFALQQKNVLDRRSWTSREQLRIAMVIWIERTYTADAVTTGWAYAYRVRGHHEHDRRTGGMTATCHLLVQQSRSRSDLPISPEPRSVTRSGR